MFNKFELIGIAGSIMSMALALYLVNLETNNLMTTSAQSNLAASAAIVVDDSKNAKDSVKTALLAGTDAAGTVQKLIIDDVVVGGGTEATDGSAVTVDYVGTLQNGEEFDNSKKRGQPFSFTIGEGRVIRGWEEGVVGMKVGGKRILVIPSDLAYGDSGYGPIPGGATLVFSIELLGVK